MNGNTKRLLGKKRRSVLTKSEHIQVGKHTRTVRTVVDKVPTGTRIDTGELRRKSGRAPMKTNKVEGSS